MSNRKIENRMFKMVAPEIWELLKQDGIWTSKKRSLANPHPPQTGSTSLANGKAPRPVASTCSQWSFQIMHQDKLLFGGKQELQKT